MKIIVNRNEFIAALDIISGIAQPNKIRPIIGNTKIVADDKITLYGTDLEQTVIIEIDGKVTEQGSIALDHTEAVEYIKEIEETEIEIEFNGEMVIIENSKYTAMDVDEYPVIQLSKESGKVIEKDILRNSIKQVQFAAAQQSDNMAIYGVRIDNDTIIASDSYRMAKSSLQEEIGINSTIPLNSLKNINKILDKFSGSEIEIIPDESRLYIKCGNIVYNTRIIDLAFPDYQNIFDTVKKTAIHTLEFNCKDLKKTLKKVMSFASKNTITKNGAIFEIMANKIIIKASNDKSKVKESVDVINSGVEMKVALNVRYIYDYISNIDGDNVVIKCSNESSAFVINDNYLIMPLAMQE